MSAQQIISVAVILCSIIAGILGGYPQYKVYSSRLDGEAILAHAHSAREVQVAQAQGEKDAALLRAQAIAIVGQAAKDFPEYRTQEFIGSFAEALKEGKINQIIYVPTEANIPLLEASKR
jgi:regulator of protease activity HflC (stomatin/prohibitin superfamily)